MKRMIIAGLSAALALAIATAAPAADKKTLVFVVNGASDFWKIAEAGVKKAQGELPNYDLQFKYPEQAAAAVQQRADGRSRRGRRAAAIMVSAVDPKNLDRRRSTGRRAGAAVHHRLAMRRSRTASPISARPTPTLGKQAGELMLKALPNGGKCIGFVGLLGADNARERIEGVKEVIEGLEGRAGRRARRRHRPDPRQAQCRGRAGRQSRHQLHGRLLLLQHRRASTRC